MGRDNQPKERQRKELQRAEEHQRASCERILIVSEGSKTEPQYFNEIRKALRLPTANIKAIASDFGTNPVQVVQYAQELFEKGDSHKGIAPKSFDRIYAVFDRDEHRRRYGDALRQAQKLNDSVLQNDEKQPVPFHAIVSIPCFELWLLLHYEDVHALLHRDKVLYRLRQHLPNYTKGMGNAYAETSSRLDDAYRRSEMLAADYEMGSDQKPYTAVADLVKYLKGLRG